MNEYFKAELTEILGEDYDLYAAILLPNGTDFIALKNTNQFAQPAQKVVSSKEARINQTIEFNLTEEFDNR